MRNRNQENKMIGQQIDLSRVFLNAAQGETVAVYGRGLGLGALATQVIAQQPAGSIAPAGDAR